MRNYDFRACADTRVDNILAVGSLGAKRSLFILRLRIFSLSVR
jgi:hypothetical protein